MTELQAEKEWLTGDDPGQLLDMVIQPHYPRVREFTERKFRLWSCACGRLVWERMTFATAACREVVELAERYADGEIPVTPLEAGSRRLEGALESVPDQEARARADCCAAEVALSAVWTDSDLAFRSRRGPGAVYFLAWDVEYYSAGGKELGEDAMWEFKERTERALSGLLRDIFGNPFRPVAFSPTWRTGTAVALAKHMYESHDFSAMPILADALQDTGCDSEDILNHCRGPGPHVRGCWVVDLVLGKE